MAKQQPTVFERAFPPNEFLKGSTRGAVVWAVFASILLILVLLNVYLLAELLAADGRLVVAVDQAEEVQRLTGVSPPVPTPMNTIGGVHLVYRDGGLLPAVWWSRNRVWGTPLALAYRKIPALQQNRSALPVVVFTAALLWLLHAVAKTRSRNLQLRTALDISSRLRLAIHRQALRLGPGNLDDDDQTHVLELFTTETDRLRDAVVKWIDGIGGSVFRVALLVLLALAIHWELTLVCAIPLGLCWFWAERERSRLSTDRQRAGNRSTSELKLLAESLRKTRLVRSYAMEDYAREQFERSLQRFQTDTRLLVRGEGLSGWGYRAVVLACSAILVYLIGLKVLAAPQDLTFAASLFLIVTMAWAYRPLNKLWHLRAERELAIEAATRIYRYLNLIPEVGQAVGAKFLQPLSRSLEFVSLSYTTPGKRRLLDGIDLQVAAGRQVAITGTDAREPLALAYLLPRFIEPQAGKVLVDGEDIAWVTLESLRAETIFVGSSDAFFTGTVLENIRGGKSTFTLTEVTEAAKLTHAHNFILKLPQGYETVIGEHGEHLDAGQSLRLGLARAVLRDPALLIIEESNSSLDEDTKALLDDAYQRITRNRTVLFLAARMSTLRRVDEIVFLHQGKIEAIGNHHALVHSSQLYRHWEYLRFNEFRKQVEPVAVG